jgi:SH3-like domain-containing protein
MLAELQIWRRVADCTGGVAWSRIFHPLSREISVRTQPVVVF